MVSQITESRGEWADAYYATGYPCGVQVNKRRQAVKILDEVVTSSRGPTRYINVGTKRRKAYNPFNRWKREATVTEGYICNGSGTMWSSSFPLYHLDANGWIPTNTHKYTGESCLGSRLQMEEYSEGLRDSVIADMYAKCNEPKFDTAVFLAELGETLVGLKELFTGISKTLQTDGLIWKLLKSKSLNSEEVWLWYRYMLIPTMLDAEDLIAAFTQNEIITRIQSGNRYKNEWSGVFASGPWSALGGKDIHLRYKCTVDVGLGGALDIVSRHDPHEWGMSAYDIMRAAWEVIPFSFVLDWFINISDWLTSLRSLEIELAQSYSSYAINATSKFWSEDEDGDDYFVFTNTEAFVAKSFLMDRVIDVEPPSFPIVEREWSSTLRMLDSISLVAGLLKGVLPRGGIIQR